MKTYILAAVIAIGSAGSLLALDASEIVTLKQHGVDDSVIINMVQSRSLDRPLTAGEVVALSSCGASPALLEYLTRPEAVAAAPSYSQPTVVTSPPAQVTVVEQAPTVVTTQPNVVVTQPQTVYYGSPYYYGYGYPYYYPYSYYSRPSYSFGLSIGRGWGGSRHHRSHGRPHGGRRR
ncbi:MAG: hypothetical protein LIP77_09140 [Planctomycetes bacterium]|nr:hypothetical protein [Planctomycetota bacterium]